MGCCIDIGSYLVVVECGWWCASSTVLDVVVGESPSILKLLPREDQALLVRWNNLLGLNLRPDVVDRVGRLDLKGDRLSREGLDENLFASLHGNATRDGGSTPECCSRKGCSRPRAAFRRR